MIGQSGAILYLLPHMISHFLAVAYLMAPLHPLVDGLKMKNMCGQIVCATFRYAYLIIVEVFSFQISILNIVLE